MVGQDRLGVVTLTPEIDYAARKWRHCPACVVFWDQSQGLTCWMCGLEGAQPKHAPLFINTFETSLSLSENYNVGGWKPLAG